MAKEEKSPSTPKNLIKSQQKTNSSFDSPYMKSRKKEIDDIANKYFGVEAIPFKMICRAKLNFSNAGGEVEEKESV